MFLFSFSEKGLIFSGNRIRGTSCLPKQSKQMKHRGERNSCRRRAKHLRIADLSLVAPSVRGRVGIGFTLIGK